MNPSRQPLASVYVKLFGQEIAFADIDKAIVDQIIEVEHLLLYKLVLGIRFLWTDYVMSLPIWCLQLGSGPAVHTYGRNILDALLSGFSLHHTKPLLVGEIRRILPTAVGLPMELSFYTAAVADVSVECNFQSCGFNLIWYFKKLCILILKLYHFHSTSHCDTTSAKELPCFSVFEVWY